MRRLPRIPAEREPTRTAILPSDLRCEVISGVRSVNDRVSTKMDMVNPIPPRQATANNIFHDAPSGIAPIFSLKAIQLATVMPYGLPMSNPRKTPRPTEPRAGEYWNILK